MTEVALWQYRWLNPGNAPNQPPSMLEWQPVEVRWQKVEDKVQELRDYRWEGKPVYEVRALVVADGPIRAALMTGAAHCEAALPARGDGERVQKSSPLAAEPAETGGESKNLAPFWTPPTDAEALTVAEELAAAEADERAAVDRLRKRPYGVNPEVAELTTALRHAATSLETIANLAGRKTYGDPPIETFMSTFHDVRMYAAARAMAARSAIDAALEHPHPALAGENQ